MARSCKAGAAAMASILTHCGYGQPEPFFRLAFSCSLLWGCQRECDVPDITQSNLDRKEDHPWDALVRLHVEETHATLISDIVKTVFVEIPSERRVWDVYKAGSCLSLL